MIKQEKSPSHVGHRKRLRTKFANGGLDVFYDHEVLELLLTYIIPRKDTKPIAWRLIKKFGSLSRVLDAKPDELTEIEGISKESTVFLSLLRALIRRYFLDEIKNKNVIKCPEDVINFCRASLEGEKDEIFKVIYLSSSNNVIDSERISIGTIDRTTIFPRKVVEGALKMRASGLIFVHNHPSGHSAPSKEDIHITNELIKAAQTLDISVHDHIIVGKSNYFSFKAHGLIKRI
jgi:DNA repair protein RadC